MARRAHEDDRRAAWSATVCTAGDRVYFPGVIALVNSLGLVGFAGTIVVLDLGFSDDQRARLELVATVVPLVPAFAETRFATSASAKAHLAELTLSGVVLWIDSDIIVTSPLEDVIDEAAAGKVCVVRDDGPEDTERGFAEWTAAFALRQPVRLGTYVNAGFFALSTDVWPDLLRRFADACARIPQEHIAVGSPQTNPFWASDQDALNAVLMSEVEPEALHKLHASEMVHARMLPKARVRDVQRLDVSYDGRKARLLHSSWAPKPWMPGAWTLIGRNAYVRLLPRLLFGRDVALPGRRSDVPTWLWPGATGSALRCGVRAGRSMRRTAGVAARKLPPRTRRRALALGARFDQWLQSR